MNNKTGKIALCGLLGALALVLSFLESLLPPLPGMPPGAKLGLSNIATMYAAGTLGLPWGLALAGLKGGFAFLGRGLAAGVMSLSGGLVSTACSWALLKRTGLSLSAVGVCGALAHNAAQLFAAYFLTSAAVVFYIPFLSVFGVLTGILTGTALKLTLPGLERVSRQVLGKRKG